MTRPKWYGGFLAVTAGLHFVASQAPCTTIYRAARDAGLTLYGDATLAAEQLKTYDDAENPLTYTVFAPDDSVWAPLVVLQKTVSPGDTPAVVTTVLNSGILSGRYLKADLVNGLTVNNLLGEELTVSVDATGQIIIANGQDITTHVSYPDNRTDLCAGSVLHVVTKGILLPRSAGGIASTASGNATYVPYIGSPPAAAAATSDPPKKRSDRHTGAILGGVLGGLGFLLLLAAIALAALRRRRKRGREPAQKPVSTGSPDSANRDPLDPSGATVRLDLDDAAVNSCAIPTRPLEPTTVLTTFGTLNALAGSGRRDMPFELPTEESTLDETKPPAGQSKPLVAWNVMMPHVQASATLTSWDRTDAVVTTVPESEAIQVASATGWDCTWDCHDLTVQLDAMKESGQLFASRYQLTGSRQRGGQGLVAFANMVQAGRTANMPVAIKFHFNSNTFRNELQLCQVPELRDCLPETIEVSPENPKGPEIRRAPNGRPLPPYVVMPLGEPLDKFILNEQPDELHCIMILMHLADKLAAMHAVGLVHRDVKPANSIWLPHKHAWNVIDYGCAARAGTMAPIMMTPRYAAPEVIRAYTAHEKMMLVHPAMDVWALGVVAYELMSNDTTLHLMGRDQLMRALKGEERLPWEDEGHFDEHLQMGPQFTKWIRAMLSRDPAARPSMYDVIVGWREALGIGGTSTRSNPRSSIASAASPGAATTTASASAVSSSMGPARPPRPSAAAATTHTADTLFHTNANTLAPDPHLTMTNGLHTADSQYHTIEAQPGTTSPPSPDKKKADEGVGEKPRAAKAAVPDGPEVAAAAAAFGERHQTEEASVRSGGTHNMIVHSTATTEAASTLTRILAGVGGGSAASTEAASSLTRILADVRSRRLPPDDEEGPMDGDTRAASVSHLLESHGVCGQFGTPEAMIALENQMDLLEYSGTPLLGKYLLVGADSRRYGGQGMVQFAKGLDGRRKYAVKFFASKEAFYNEEALYKVEQLRPFLPPLTDIVSNGDKAIRDSSGKPVAPFLVMEKGEALDEWSERSRPDFVTSIQVIIHLVSAVNRLHQEGLVHRDLKPGNAMWLPSRNAWTIIDYGSAACHGDQASLCMTLAYAAPETVAAYDRGDAIVTVDSAVDVWALGMVAFEVFSRSTVFSPTTSRRQMIDMLLGKRPLPWEADSPHMEGRMKKLGMMRNGIMAMLHRNPDERATLPDVLASWKDLLGKTTTTAATE